MGVDDYMGTETGVVAAATAAAVSPRARELFRRGVVYGLAGVLKASDVAVSAARGAVQGAKEGAAASSNGAASTGSRRSPQRRQTARSQSSRKQTRSKRSSSSSSGRRS